MKILLIHPPPFEEYIYSNFGSTLLYPPLGLAYLAGSLREKGHDVSIFDGNVLRASIKETTAVIKDYSPDLVGITSTTPNFPDAIGVADAVKAIDINIKVVLGGSHPTVAPEHVLSNSNVDIVVIGEGEETISELVHALESGERISHVNGIGFKRDDKVVLTDRRQFIFDLDSLPFPAYDLLPIEKYSAPQALRIPFMTMFTSRGCPYKCIFCGQETVFGHKIRAHSPERVVSEIEYLIEKFGVKEILFKDSEFTLIEQRVSEICDLIIEKNLDITWLCDGRVNNVSKEMLRKMKLAGCREITYGVESGDQEILNALKKNITLEDARRAFSLTKEVGIEAIANFMIGNPGETMESLERTMAFAKELDPDFAVFNFLVPTLGTELYRQAKREKWIFSESCELFRGDKCMMNATKISTEELNKYLSKMYRSFYLRPSYILKRLTKLRLHNFRSVINGLRVILYKP